MVWVLPSFLASSYTFSQPQLYLFIPHYLFSLAPRSPFVPFHLSDLRSRVTFQARLPRPPPPSLSKTSSSGIIPLSNNGYRPSKSFSQFVIVHSLTQLFDQCISSPLYSRLGFYLPLSTNNKLKAWHIVGAQ